MRRVTVASAAFLVALAGPAFAADPTVDLPTTAPGFDWTGYYAGLRAGYGWGSSDITGTDGTPFSSPDLSGGYIGGQVAGLWQFNQFVIGSEADLNYSGINGSADQAPGNSFGTNIEWFGSINAKAGYAMDRYLVYGTGGVAFAGIETKQDSSSDFSRTRTNAGWTIGAGVDYALTDKFTVGAQYRYYDFGSDHYDGNNSFSDRNQDVKLNTVGINLNYKF